MNLPIGFHIDTYQYKVIVYSELQCKVKLQYICDDINFRHTSKMIVNPNTLSVKCFCNKSRINSRILIEKESENEQWSNYPYNCTVKLVHLNHVTILITISDAKTTPPALGTLAIRKLIKIQATREYVEQGSGKIFADEKEIIQFAQYPMQRLILRMPIFICYPFFYTLGHSQVITPGDVDEHVFYVWNLKEIRHNLPQIVRDAMAILIRKTRTKLYTATWHERTARYLYSRITLRSIFMQE